MACLPLTADQQALAGRHVALAHRLAWPYRRAFRRLDADLESAALLALAEAAGSYRPDAGASFKTYAQHKIRWALRDVLRADWPRGWPESATRPEFLPLECYSEHYGRVVTATPDAPVGSDLDAIEAVEAWLRKLPRQHAAAGRWIYLHGKGHAEAARQMGLSVSYVDRLHRETLAMLRGDAPPPRRGRRKLTDSQVAQILDLYHGLGPRPRGHEVRALACRFGVCRSTIYTIIQRNATKGLPCSS